MLQFLGTALVAFFGLVLGQYVLFVAPEELEPGRKWFKLVASILLACVAYFSFQHSFFRVIIASLAFVVVFMLPKQALEDGYMRNFFKMVVGAVTGIIFFFAHNSIISGSLIFLFFIAFSGFMFFPKRRDIDVKKTKVRRKWKYIKDIVLPTATFFVCILLFILF
jgi:hypothetical protein